MRDWGHAKDYVKMQWLMLQQNKPDDYVIATGKQYSVRNFVEIACQVLGIEITWKGKGLNEYGVISKINKKLGDNIKVGNKIVKVSSKYYRPSEVDTLLGDASKAKIKLGWKPEIKFIDMVKEMVLNDLQNTKNIKYNLENNFFSKEDDL